MPRTRMTIVGTNEVEHKIHAVRFQSRKGAKEGPDLDTIVLPQFINVIVNWDLKNREGLIKTLSMHTKLPTLLTHNSHAHRRASGT
jgi:hypothetical protein